MTTANASLRLPAVVALAAVLLGGGLSASRTDAAPAALTMETAPHPTVAPLDAMKLANKKINGKPIAANLGFEDGHWLYDVLIIKGQTLNEVEVDARTGKTAAAEVVTPEDEGKETMDDLSAAMGRKPAAIPTATKASGAAKSTPAEKSTPAAKSIPAEKSAPAEEKD